MKNIIAFAVLFACPATLLAQAPEAAPPRSLMFQKGDWDLNVYAGVMDDWSDDVTLTHGTVALEYFFIDDLAGVAEFVVYDINQDPGPDATGGGINLGLRWHFAEFDRLAFYLEGLVGFIQADARVPAPRGTHFNFTEQVGLGAKFQLTDQISLIGGGRYMHLSNADKNGDNRNPGFDGIGGYGGITINF